MAHKASANHGHHPKHAPPRRQERCSQEVWATNLEDEMSKLRDVAEEYQHVAMDMLLPGVIAQPTGPFEDYAQYNYQTLRANVGLTRVVQIGLTLSDADGARPKGVSTWRFNFDFDLSRDPVAQELVEAWRRNCGLDLEKHHSQGIDPLAFGEFLMSSGLVLNDEIRWVAFCGAKSFSERAVDAGSMQGRPGELPWVSFCGMYTFGHLLQLVTSETLPDSVKGLKESLDIFFPCRCDIADHLHQLPQLNGRDPADPQRRPFFCHANHVLEAFFCLPEGVRRTAFDHIEEEPQAPPEPERRKKARSKNESNSRLQSGISAGAGAHGAAAVAVNGPLNGHAKTGGG